jgi:putative salt-induced outer membrane protein YdiY
VLPTTLERLVVHVGVIAVLLVAPTVYAQAGNGGAPAEPPAIQAPAAPPAPAPPPPDWTGSVNFGLALTQGNNDTVNANGGFDVKYDPKTRYVFKTSGLFLYGETGGEATAEQYALNAREEFKLNARTFVFGDFRYLHDKFKGIRYLVAPTGGIGYKLADLPATTLAVGLGAGGVWEEDYGFDSSSSGALTLDEKFTHKLTATATIGQSFLALWKTNDFDDALYTFGANFAVVISKRVQLKVDLLDTYKNKPQDTTLKRNDLSLIVGVVFKF